MQRAGLAIAGLAGAVLATLYLGPTAAMVVIGVIAVLWVAAAAAGWL